MARDTWARLKRNLVKEAQMVPPYLVITAEGKRLHGQEAAHYWHVARASPRPRPRPRPPRPPCFDFVEA